MNSSGAARDLSEWPAPLNRLRRSIDSSSVEPLIQFERWSAAPIHTRYGRDHAASERNSNPNLESAVPMRLYSEIQATVAGRVSNRLAYPTAPTLADARSLA
jgi:hypothetical protein